jgi:glycosyltransferase involved in cell wall biosynthesis
VGELGAPLPWDRVRVLPPPVAAAGGTRDPRLAGPPQRDSAERGAALVVSRLAPEKGVDVAVEACRLAGIPLVVAGDGPELGALRDRARGANVRFLGWVGEQELTRLRAEASIALAPSRSAETFGMAAAEAMAAGLPVAASRVGALPELLDPEALVEPGDHVALAEAIRRRAGDREAGERGRRRIAGLCAPPVVAAGLAEIYGAAGTEVPLADRA